MISELLIEATCREGDLQGIYRENEAAAEPGPEFHGPRIAILAPRLAKKSRFSLRSSHPRSLNRRENRVHAPVPRSGRQNAAAISVAFCRSYATVTPVDDELGPCRFSKLATIQNCDKLDAVFRRTGTLTFDLHRPSPVGGNHMNRRTCHADFTFPEFANRSPLVTDTTPLC